MQIYTILQDPVLLYALLCCCSLMNFIMTQDYYQTLGSGVGNRMTWKL